MTPAVNVVFLSKPPSLQEKIKRAKKDAKFLKEYSNIVAQRAQPLELGKVNREIRQFTKKKREGGDTLVKAAAILLICPDPATDAAGLALLAAAKIKSSKKSSDLERVYESANKIITSISSGELSL